METYCVYKHTAPNKKVYIGITSKKPQRRWNNGNGYRENPYFYKAICKYGWENIAHEILFFDLSSEEAQQKERELIKQYHSFDRKYGYNLTTGGEAGKEHSESSKRKTLIHLHIFLKLYQVLYLEEMCFNQARAK